MAARVVEHDAARPERSSSARPHQHVAARRGEPVQPDDRRPRARSSTREPLPAAAVIVALHAGDVRRDLVGLRA